MNVLFMMLLQIFFIFIFLSNLPYVVLLSLKSFGGYMIYKSFPLLLLILKMLLNWTFLLKDFTLYLDFFLIPFNFYISVFHPSLLSV